MGPIITQLLSVLMNSYHQVGIAPAKGWLFQQLNVTDGLTGLIVYFLVFNANQIIN